MNEPLWTVLLSRTWKTFLLDPAYVVLQLIKPAPTRKTSGQRHVQSFTVNSLLDLNQELARWSVWVVWIIDNPEWQYLCGPGCSLKHRATDQVSILTHEWQQVCFSLTVFWFSPPQSRFHTCLFAGLSAGSHKSYWTDFHQTGTGRVSAQNRPGTLLVWIQIKEQIQECFLDFRNYFDVFVNFSGNNSRIRMKTVRCTEYENESSAEVYALLIHLNPVGESAGVLSLRVKLTQGGWMESSCLEKCGGVSSSSRCDVNISRLLFLWAADWLSDWFSLYSGSVRPAGERTGCSGRTLAVCARVSVHAASVCVCVVCAESGIIAPTL